MKEKHVEEIIAKYPELIEEGLKLIDLLFEDRHAQKWNRPCIRAL
jgi:RecB family endonuclease NucS